MRLIQFLQDGERKVGAILTDEAEPSAVRGATHVRDLALEAHRTGAGLEQLVRSKGLGDRPRPDRHLAATRPC